MLDVLFLGTAPAMPEEGGDTASLALNGHILVDTGWCGVLRLPRFGIDPLAVTHLFFTHFHQDHYLGFPHLLFHRAMRLLGGKTLVSPLTIAGPAGEVERIVALTQAFLQADQESGIFPPLEVVPLEPGDRVTVGTLEFAAGRAVHTVPALCYRVTDTETGAVLGVTGDTAFDAGVVAHLMDSDLLIAEASTASGRATPPNPFQHMGPLEAAEMAVTTRARRLALTHGRQERRAAAVETARSLFPETFWPADGERIRLGD